MSKRPGDPGYAAGWCIHYRARDPKTGADYKTCEAGVEFESVRQFGGQPCFLTDAGESRPDARPCPSLRRPTVEEIGAHEGWLARRIDLITTVMVGIKPWRDAHKGRSASEIVECPACKGRLHLSISGYNGHIHGKCATEGCVSWME